MTATFWLGILIGAATVTAVEILGGALVVTFLKGADMAEERAWTGDEAVASQSEDEDSAWTSEDDHELLRLARDLNGEA